MKAHLKPVLVCGLFGPRGYTLLAQTPAATCSPSGRTFGPLGVSSLSGCPFSADVEIERSQTVVDGTHIQTSAKAHRYRDSQGGIRYQSYPPANVEQDVPDPVNMMQIHDPVAGTGCMLLAQNAIAHRHKPPGTAPRPEVVGQPQGAASSASQPAQDVRPRAVFENLGTPGMEGTLATGTRTTRTIASGVEGNDRVLTVVRVIGRSQNMGVALLEKRSDPRTGDAETRRTNLEQSEPDAAQFKPRGDYASKDH